MSRALDQLKNVSAKDRKQIEEAQEMLGPEPETMGFVKNLHWGRFREELVFPFPEVSAEETERCDKLLAELEAYLRNEHPATRIDREQEIPEEAINRLFKMGVMGMIIPQEYGGGGYGVTSYNRVLELIGRYCGSTAVMVSAHQSIGCGAINLFGTEEQKRVFLPRVGGDSLSAFCLSEPNVGSDAAGQRTRCELSECGKYYILNGEKKWATSAPRAGLFTVLAKQKLTSKKTGKTRDGVTALICTPDMEGIEIFSRNRSKCGIRGTWQGRIRFTNVKVPVENRLHKEGKGLNVALTCLNYGRCTLAAGMVGAAKRAYEQAVKWGRYRYQFDRPIADFEQVQNYLATSAAYCYAMDAMLYMTTGMVDRGDEDIMVETAVCKVFCSEMGFRTVDHAMQVMGGESYMTENVVERLWRDSRINIIVEGANDVMYSFIFGYGGKQLGEFLLGVKASPLRHFGEATKIGAELFLGMRRAAPKITRLHPKLDHLRRDVESRVQELSHQIKLAFKENEEKLLTRQMVQRRLATVAMWIHAMACSLAKLDRDIRNGLEGERLDEDLTLVEHVCALGGQEIDTAIRGLRNNADETMRKAAQVALKQVGRLPNSDYSIPESTLDDAARGTGRKPDADDIQDFGSGTLFDLERVPGAEVEVG
jgi:alkylation response protein AidB-like acyl-CoA dehydrogenase